MRQDFERASELGGRGDFMTSGFKHLVSLFLFLSFAKVGATDDTAARELIVSHSDESGVLQLYRMKEDGSERTQLTQSEHGARMPAISPDAKKIVYVEQINHGLVLRLSALDGKDARSLTETGRNLVPSWLPDSKHVVWMKTKGGKDPSHDSEIHLMNTETGESRRLFTDPEQLQFSNAMPVVSPTGDQIAFVSNRSGHMRIWVSRLDGSEARIVSPPEFDIHEELNLAIEQKVPAWSPDGKWIAHWEGVEIVHMSKFTGVENRERDQKIAATFHVWVARADGSNRRKSGRGDDPTWSPDGFVTRAFPDQKRGGPKIMVEMKDEPKELPLVPPRRHFGRFDWIPDP